MVTLEDIIALAFDSIRAATLRRHARIPGGRDQGSVRRTSGEGR